MPELTSSDVHSRCVLIVEDEVHQRTMLLRAIRDAEYEPVAVSSAEDALKQLDLLPVSIMVLDLYLPGMNGLELARRTHAQWPHIQQLILTGYGSLEAAQQAIRMDVVDFLLKPCSLAELEAALARAWDRVVRSHRPAPLPELSSSCPTPAPAPVQRSSAFTNIDIMERELILAALRRHNNNRTKAAEELGISVRTLYYRLSRYEAEARLRTEGSPAASAEGRP